MVGTVGRAGGVWSHGRAPTTVGILLLISLTAFEAMGVGTAMPVVVADLGGIADYAWPFVVFLAAAVFGTAFGGWWCDARGPRVPLVVAPAVFGAGLLVAGVATTMAGLLSGRVLQGLGAGVQGVAVYVLVAAVYPARLRPAVFGLISSAWVLPSLAGPPLAGVVTERFSWHWVFLGLLPVVGLALVLVLPAVRRLGPPSPQPPSGGGGTVLAALGAATGVAALSWASEHLDARGAAVGAVALVVLVPALRRLLPRGTFAARPGVPAVVAARGLVAAAFFTVVSFLPLLMTATHGWSPATAGIPLIVASLGWSGAAAWQARHPDRDRSVMLRSGFAAILAGQLGLLPVAAGVLPGWVAIGASGLAGLGMGVAFSAIAFLTLAHSAPADVGSHSSAAQLLDQLATAAFVGLGGALLVLLTSPALALPVLLAVVAVPALTGVAAASRTRLPARSRPDPPAPP